MFDNVGYEGVDALGGIGPEDGYSAGGEVRIGDQAGSDGIVGVVVEVGEGVGDLADLGLEGRGVLPPFAP